jgi:DNA-binding transcriptional LysR family regulator
MDRLALMQAFARVAETRSFSAAAQRLGASKSQISRQVAALEAELGVRLLQRTTRALTLTQAGEDYYQRVLRILNDIDQANEEISRSQSTPRGRLRLSAPMSFGLLHLAPAVPDFLTQYPDIEIDLSLNDRFVDLIEDGFDMAIRIARLNDSSLVARKLAPMRRVVCGSPDYFERHGQPNDPGELKHHHCFCYSNLPIAEDWRFVDRDGRPWPVEVAGRLRANNGEFLMEAALKGLGLICLPTFIVGRNLQAGRLVSVLNDYVAQGAGIHAVYPNARHLSPKVRALIDFLIERFGPRPYWDLVE